MILIAERSCACLDNSCFVSDEWWNTGDCKWTSFYIALFLLYLSTWSTLHNMPHSSINARNFCLCFLPLFPFFCVFYLAFTTILTCFIQSTLSAKSPIIIFRMFIYFVFRASLSYLFFIFPFWTFSACGFSYSVSCRSLILQCHTRSTIQQPN